MSLTVSTDTGRPVGRITLSGGTLTASNPGTRRLAEYALRRAGGNAALAYRALATFSNGYLDVREDDDGTIGAQLTMAGGGWEGIPRDSHGRWTRGAGGVIEHVPIGKEGARGNSRAVSHEEFQQAASEGRDRLRAIQGAPWSTGGLHSGWEAIKARTYAEVQKSWGGATVDPRTGHDLPQGADKYAMSIKPTGLDTTSVSEHASPEEFGQAMDIARDKYASQLGKGGSYLGIFHDDDLNRIDIDPVTVLDTLKEVETIGAYTHAVGGAYHFKSGDGFWPPHVPEGAQMSAEDGHWAGPGQWHSHAVAVQQPHDEPEDADDSIGVQLDGGDDGGSIGGQLDLAEQDDAITLARLDEYLDEAVGPEVAAYLGTIGGQLDLAAVHGHHVPGTAYTFRHGWIPVAGKHVIDKYPGWLVKRQAAEAPARRPGKRTPDAQARRLTAAQRKAVAAQRAPGGGMQAETTRRSTAPAPAAGSAVASAAAFQAALPPQPAGMRAAAMPPAAAPGTEGAKLAAADPALAGLAAPGMSAEAVKAYIDARVAIEVARQTEQITTKQEAGMKTALARMHQSQQKLIATIRRQYTAAAEDKQHSLRTKLVMNHLFNAAGVAIAVGGLQAGLDPVLAMLSLGITPLVNIIHDYVRSL